MAFRDGWQEGYLCVTCLKKVCEGDWSPAEHSNILIVIVIVLVYNARLDGHRNICYLGEFGLWWKLIQF